MSSSFAGQVIVDGVLLVWSTDGEDATVDEYRLYRYNCSAPATCSTLVATFAAAQSCTSAVALQHTDYPPSPVSQWAYSLEVWQSSGLRACAIDVLPQ